MQTYLIVDFISFKERTDEELQNILKERAPSCSNKDYEKLHIIISKKIAALAAKSPHFDDESVNLERFNKEFILDRFVHFIW